MKVLAVWAVQAFPDEACVDLHEFALRWYRFTADPTLIDPVLRRPARPGVWIRFNQVEELEQVQARYPEAALGPAASFTEALIFTKEWEQAQTLQATIFGLSVHSDAEEMARVIREETMEDY